jgi:hypothetical protein
VERPRRLVAEHRLAPAGTAALDDDVPLVRELTRREAEEQKLVLTFDLPDPDEDLGRVGHTRIGLHLCDQALGKHRSGEI